MVTAECIPEWADRSLTGLEDWWQSLAVLGLIFHPDDSPEVIVNDDTGRRLFNAEACIKLKSILFDMFSLYGDAVYDASHKGLMGHMGWIENNQASGWVRKGEAGMSR